MTRAADASPNLLLRCIREQRGWSRAYVAEQIGIADPKTVGRWERGISHPNAHFRQKLCALFKKQAEDLGLGQSTRAYIQDTSFNSGAGNQQAMYATIHDPAIPPSKVRPTGLMGRNKLFHELKQRLCTEKGISSIALYGLPGIGKTALAVELAYDDTVSAHFYDGVLWISVGPEPSVIRHLERWGSLFGLSSVEVLDGANVADWARALRIAIGMRRMLLIIDDVWMLEDALAFKIGGPHCAYLVTTRVPEVALRFAAMGATKVSELREEESLEVLAQFTPELITHNVEVSRRLVQLVGGHPLALTLMGKYVQLQTHSGQPRHLDNALAHLFCTEKRLQINEPLALLEQHPSLPCGTPLSLQSMIEVSDHRLDENARNTLYALAIFPAKPNSFSEEAALRVGATTVEVLDRLVNVGLLESYGPGRYTLHQTIVDYASIKRTTTVAEERMVEYFAHYIAMHQLDHEVLTLEMKNVLAALQIAYEHGMHTHLVWGTIAFFQCLRLQGLYASLEMFLRRAKCSARFLGDTIGLITLLFDLGIIAYEQKKYLQATAHFQEGFLLARCVLPRASVMSLCRT